MPNQSNLEIAAIDSTDGNKALRVVTNPNSAGTDPSAWIIQVGSFSRRINAHKAAIQARRMAGQPLSLVPANISLVMRGNMPLWRVRFDGLGEDQARAACAELYASGNACFALPDAVAQNS